MFPKPLELSHQKDAIRFLINFGKLAAVAVIYTVIINIFYGTTPVEIFLLCADMITIVVPPALPAALAIGVFYSQKRLKKDHRIFCTSPQRINCGGQLSLVAFDKTGTLTEDRFSLVRYLSFDESSTNDVKLAMAVCHTLTISQSTGEIIGDPLDIELFQKSGYTFPSDNDQLITSKETGEDVKIIKQNPFNSENRCMDVLIQTESGEKRKLIKGAPEKLASLIKKSKIPKNFYEDVENSTKEGLRVLAVGEGDHKDVTKILGLLILVNELKKETIPTLEKLHYANFRLVMITGDNIVTAMNVAKNSGLVKDHQKIKTIEKIQDLNENDKFSEETVLACTGNLLEDIVIKDDFISLNKLVELGAIFARMKPNHKEQLISMFIKSGETVAMVGDGANDCNALKLAHCGISLSQLEASVAAHFTSFDANIECVEKLAREGRCALVTSFALFKYILIYCMIQLTSICIVYYNQANFGDYQYLYIDMFIIDTMAFTFNFAGPSKKLSKNKPLTSLMETSNLLSLFSQIGLQMLFQMVYFLLAVSFMDCYRNGYISGQNLLCECTQILNPDKIITPDFVVNGEYEYEIVTDSYDKKPENATAVCLDNGCEINYSMKIYENYSDIILPNPKINIFKNSSKDDWMETCTYVQPMEHENQIYGLHYAVSTSYSGSLLFYFSVFLYLSLAFVFTPGAPFREPIHTHYGLILSIVVLGGFIVYVMVVEPNWAVVIFELVEFPEKEIIYILIGALLPVYFMIAFMMERLIGSTKARKILDKIV